MKKTLPETNVLQNIEVAFSESEELLMNAHLIKTTEKIDASMTPVSFIDSDFGLWLISKSRSSAKHLNFSKVSKLHQNIYEAYSKVYHCAKNTSDSKSKGSISDYYVTFEKLIDKYHDSLQKVVEETSKIKKESNNQAVNELDIILKENIDRLETKNPVAHKTIPIKTPKIKSKVKSNVEKTFDTLKKVKNSKTVSTEYLAVREELEREAQKQLMLKKQVIEQEIKQISERQKLFIEAASQQTHHYQLIQQEAKLTTSKYNSQVTQNTDLQNKKKQDLEDAETNRITTQNELKQLELVNVEIEESNTKELTQIQASLTELDEFQQVAREELNKKIKQQDRKKQRIEKLKDQIAQAENDLESFVKDEMLLIEKEKDVTQAKSSVRNEIKELLATQQQKRDHNSQLEDTKYQNLNQLKTLYYSLQKEILHLEHEQQNLIESKQDSDHSKQREIAELQKQQNTKQDMLNILELELQQKNQELQNLAQKNKPLSVNNVAKTTVIKKSNPELAR